RAHDPRALLHGRRPVAHSRNVVPTVSRADEARAMLTDAPMTEAAFIRHCKRLARRRQWVATTVDDLSSPIRLIAARRTQCVAVIVKPSHRLDVEQADHAWAYAQAGIHVLFLDPSDADHAARFF
ncbi:MAG: hypothetical protein Q8K63_15905, partial [Acidimicrobiales bacterium]|nr:hypothetical protein [Acidimicrobiales bacterium]